MYGYIKLIIFIVVLLLISVAVVFIHSSVDNINQSMPQISDSIVQGDIDYNESVELLNSRNYKQASQKAQSAGDNYNDSLKKLSQIRQKYDKDLHEVHKDYIDTTIKELETKLNAVEELEESIYYLGMYYNYTGSTHGTEANEIMADAIKYQSERNNIIQENPKLFT